MRKFKEIEKVFFNVLIGNSSIFDSFTVACVTQYGYARSLSNFNTTNLPIVSINPQNFIRIGKKRGNGGQKIMLIGSNIYEIRDAPELSPAAGVKKGIYRYFVF